MNSTNNRLTVSLPRQQQGAVLAVTMIMLMTMTVIGISALSNTRMQETMASNVQEKTRVMQAADSGVLDAWMGTEMKSYNENVNKFDCDKYANKQKYAYSDLYPDADQAGITDDPFGVIGTAQYKKIGRANSQGVRGSQDGINGSQTPQVFFVWRSRAETNATRSKGSVYMGIRVDGADPGANLTETGNTGNDFAIDPC